jgi:hypothetical protein
VSTRAVVTFGDPDQGDHHDYQHQNGYPEGIAQVLARALPLTWPQPRYEGEHFAAAFAAACVIDAVESLTLHGTDKSFFCTHGTRLFKDWKYAMDIEYHYRVEDRHGKFLITAWSVHCVDEANDVWDERRLYCGTLTGFLRRYGKGKTSITK